MAITLNGSSHIRKMGELPVISYFANACQRLPTAQTPC
jgi:hypothetical protein